MDNLNYFKGFKWYLPNSFSPCIYNCKFEQGDIIYKNKPTGKNWGEEIKNIDFIIQIESPLRTQNENNGNNVFQPNWNTFVTFLKHYPNDKTKDSRITTTQGRLMEFLITDNETILTSTEHTTPFINKMKNDSLNEILLKQFLSEDEIGVAFLLNYSNDAKVFKNNTITDDLEHLGLTKLYIDPKLVTEESGTIMPSLKVVIFIFDNTQKDELFNELKKTLFKGEVREFDLELHFKKINF